MHLPYTQSLFPILTWRCLCQMATKCTVKAFSLLFQCYSTSNTQKQNNWEGKGTHLLGEGLGAVWTTKVFFSSSWASVWTCSMLVVMQVSFSWKGFPTNFTLEGLVTDAMGSAIAFIAHTDSAVISIPNCSCIVMFNSTVVIIIIATTSITIVAAVVVIIVGSWCLCWGRSWSWGWGSTDTASTATSTIASTGVCGGVCIRVCVLTKSLRRDWRIFKVNSIWVDRLACTYTASGVIGKLVVYRLHRVHCDLAPRKGRNQILNANSKFAREIKDARCRSQVAGLSLYILL